ncbi:efflux RND transporter periplasmic adaptor subunit [Phycisphaerales bacterium]|nr:efflux RND transporter periplasmic adaptor subunit [Phycisphaerales bacterium]RPG20154.1 MAG: biotin/lipoyl-binding protein [Phycisphaera sp. TMED9]
MTDAPERPDSPPKSPKNPTSREDGTPTGEPSKSPYDATATVRPVPVVFPDDPEPARVRLFRTKRLIGRILGPACILGGIVAVIWLATTLDVRPRTLDAAVRANTVGIAPHVSGPIVDLQVVDNQPVSRGDVLFRIDPRPYAANLAEAEATLALVNIEIAALQAAVLASERAVSESEAHLEETVAKAVYAQLYLERVRPLLTQRFVTPDQVDKAASEAAALQATVRTAEATVDARRADLAVAIASLGELADVESAVSPDAAAAEDDLVVEEPLFDPEASEDDEEAFNGTMLNARRLAAEAAVEKARLYLEYCTVRSPIDGYVTNLNIATGEYANEGRQVFSLVDGSIWYVMANFKETYLSFIEVGDEVEVYLMARPAQRWKGVIQGVGWAIDLADGRNIPGTDLPRVDQTFDWVRLAQRFPVRIILEDGPDFPIRMGETAAVIVLPGEGELPPPQFPWLRRIFTDLNLDN